MTKVNPVTNKKSLILTMFKSKEKASFLSYFTRTQLHSKFH